MTGTLLNPSCGDCVECEENPCIEDDAYWLDGSDTLELSLISLLDWAPFITGSNQSVYESLLGTYVLEKQSSGGDVVFFFDGSTASPLVLFYLSVHKSAATGIVTLGIQWYRIESLFQETNQILDSLCRSPDYPNGILQTINIGAYPFGAFRPAFNEFAINGRHYAFASVPFTVTPYPASAWWAPIT